jgi:AGCS family alanine or glycine:cation symporter
MQDLNQILLTLDSYIGGSAWFVYLLLGTGLFFTVYLKFPQIKYFRHSIKVVMGKYDKKGDKGDTSHFQALTTALSGTVGTGNIAGVALAIHLGGPAALFWMLLTAFLGMTTKFVEVTLSHKYREVAADGSISGGPMYYMKNRLNMKWLAIIFAIATIISSFGTGNLPQVNSIANAMHSTFGIDNMLTGGILAVLLGFVIIGGIKRIAKVTEKLVPMMALIYIIGSFLVIFYNYDNIIPSILLVSGSIFTGTAAVGGFLGASIAFAFNRGVNRGLFSNEAGQGSAPIAHAAARTSEPVSEGMVAILEPFIDTIIICMITGMVILSSGVWNEKHMNTFQFTDLIILENSYVEDNPEDKERLTQYVLSGNSIPVFTGNLEVDNGIIQNDLSLIHNRSLAENVTIYENNKVYSGTIVVSNGVVSSSDQSRIVFKGASLMNSAPLTAEAFTRSFLGDYGKYIVSIGLLLFAFSTAISWSYYGGRAVTFLWGVKYEKYYRIVYVIGFFIASFTDTTLIWTFSGIAIALMTLPNLFGILMLHKEMKSSIRTYWINFSKSNPEVKIPFKIKDN